MQRQAMVPSQTPDGDLKSSKAPHPLLRATAGGVCVRPILGQKLLGKLHHLFDGSIEMGLLNRWAA